MSERERDKQFNRSIDTTMTERGLQIKLDARFRQSENSEFPYVCESKLMGH